MSSSQQNSGQGRSSFRSLKTAVIDVSSNLEVPISSMYAMCVVAFLDWLSVSISAPVVPYFTKYLGGGESDVGYIYALQGAITFLFMPYFGRLADQYGRKKILMLALFLSATGQTLSSFSPNLMWYYACQGLSGIGPAAYVVVNTYISDVSLSAETRAYWFAQTAAYPAVSGGIGFPIGGYLAAISYALPLLADGIVTYSGVLLAWFCLCESPVWERMQENMVEDEDGNKSPAVSDIVSDEEKKYMPFAAKLLMVESFFCGVSRSGMLSMTVLYMSSAYGFTPDHATLYLIPFSFVIFMSKYYVPYLQGHVGMYGTATLGALLCCCGQLWIAFAPLWNIGGFYVHSIGAGCRFATLSSILGGYTNQYNRTHVFAQMQMWGALGRVIAPAIAGNLAEINIYVWPWVFMCIGNAIAAVTIFYASKHCPTSGRIEEHLEEQKIEEHMLEESHRESTMLVVGSPSARGPFHRGQSFIALDEEIVRNSVRDSFTLSGHLPFSQNSFGSDTDFRTMSGRHANFSAPYSRFSDNSIAEANEAILTQEGQYGLWTWVNEMFGKGPVAPTPSTEERLIRVNSAGSSTINPNPNSTINPNTRCSKGGVDDIEGVVRISKNFSTKNNDLPITSRRKFNHSAAVERSHSSTEIEAGTPGIKK